MLKLKDPSLFKQQSYIAGAWADADDGKTIAVTNQVTPARLFLSAMLAYVGLDPQRDVTWQESAPAETLQRFVDGTDRRTFGSAALKCLAD